MRQEKILQIIRGSIVTEKASSAISRKQIVFRVARDANKNDIKKAVEQLLEIKVMAINIVNAKGKLKRFGQYYGHRKSFKKAYISLSKDVDMEVLLSGQQV